MVEHNYLYHYKFLVVKDLGKQGKQLENMMARSRELHWTIASFWGKYAGARQNAKSNFLKTWFF